MASLQEQLLKAGLADEKKAREVRNEKRKQRKQQPKGATTVNEAEERARKARQEKAERDRQLNLERKKEAEKKQVCEHLEGWSLGDIVWGISSTGDIIRGEIKVLHDVDQISSKGPKKKLGKAATIVTLVDSKYRTLLLSTLSEEKIRKKRPTKLKSKK